MSWCQLTVWRGLGCCSRGSRGYGGGPSFIMYPSDMFFFMDPYRNQRRRMYDRTVGGNMQVDVLQQFISPSMISFAFADVQFYLGIAHNAACRP